MLFLEIVQIMQKSKVPAPPGLALPLGCARSTGGGRPVASNRDAGGRGLNSQVAKSSTGEVKANSRRTRPGLAQRSSPAESLAAAAEKLVAAGGDNGGERSRGPMALLKACAHSGDIVQAEAILLRLEAEGELSVTVYNSVIHACVQKGDADRIEYYIDRMRNRGVEPDVKTYNVVINAYASMGDSEQAQLWLNRMVERGVKPTLITYGTICKALARHGLVDRIEDIMKLLERSGEELNEYFYVSLIYACGASQPPDYVRVEEVFRELVTKGIKPLVVKHSLTRVLGTDKANSLMDSVVSDLSPDRRREDEQKQQHHVRFVGVVKTRSVDCESTSTDGGTESSPWSTASSSANQPAGVGAVPCLSRPNSRIAKVRSPVSAHSKSCRVPREVGLQCHGRGGPRSNFAVQSSLSQADSSRHVVGPPIAQLDVNSELPASDGNSRAKLNVTAKPYVPMSSLPARLDLEFMSLASTSLASVTRLSSLDDDTPHTIHEPQHVVQQQVSPIAQPYTPGAMLREAAALRSPWASLLEDIMREPLSLPSVPGTGEVIGL